MVHERGERFRVLAAFAAIYVIWGSTYLAIRYAIDTIPPFTMMGIRSVVAGGILYGWGRFRGSGSPTGKEWVRAFVVGGLLFLVGHGALAWAQQRVPSGVASLFIATIPIWMTLLQAMTDGRATLGLRSVLGILGGTAGVVLLMSPRGVLGGEAVDPVGAAVLVLSAISWSIGSALARSKPTSRAVPAATGMYLTAGGVLLLGLGVVAGETANFRVSAISVRSSLSMVYLVFFGSVVAFGAYGWLLKHASLSAISTYAWVNPVVALHVGWLVAGEAMNTRVVVAALMVLASVVLILSGKEKKHDSENLAWQNASGRREGLRPVRAGNGRIGAAADAGQPGLDGAHCSG